MRRISLVAGLIFPLLLASVSAQEFSALARIITDTSHLIDRGDSVELQLTLSQGVPYRVFSLDAPRRIVVDFNEVDFAGLDIENLDNSKIVSGVRVGSIAAGWSRLVLDIDRPLAVETAGLTISADSTAQVLIHLAPSDVSTYSENSGVPDSVRFQPSSAAITIGNSIQRQTGDRPLVVVLDPGHGGIDPGAERGDVVESDVMLTFARELKEVLVRAGGFDVVLTRQDDDFVPLEARVSIARQASADLFLSLHADALVEGRASGSTVYTLSESASDIASQKLAERHDRGDLLAGVDLSNQDDAVAQVLMGLARVETAPRSDNLANALVAGLSETISMHKRPKLTAGVSVLKAPDIPSVLLELGFLSSERDRTRLTDKNWRGQAAIGIRNALQQWAISDAADAQLLRK